MYNINTYKYITSLIKSHICSRFYFIMNLLISFKYVYSIANVGVNTQVISHIIIILQFVRQFRTLYNIIELLNFPSSYNSIIRCKK